MAIAESLEEYLASRHIAYEVFTHPKTSTAMQTVNKANIPADRMVKCVVLEDDAGYVMAVVPASHRVDLGKIRAAMNRRLGLAMEDEFSEMLNDCTVGAVPPVGQAYGMATIIADELSDQPDIYLEGGDHQALVHLTGGQFNALMTGAVHGDISHRV